MQPPPYTAYSGSLEDAHNELEKLNIPFTMGEFMSRAKKGDTTVVDLFLVAGMYYNAKDVSRSTALMWAASGGHTETVKLLLEKGASIDAENRDGETALTLAEAGGHAQTAEVLASMTPKSSNRRGRF